MASSESVSGKGVKVVIVRCWTRNCQRCLARPLKRPTKQPFSGPPNKLQLIATKSREVSFSPLSRPHESTFQCCEPLLLRVFWEFQNECSTFFLSFLVPDVWLRLQAEVESNREPSPQPVQSCVVTQETAPVVPVFVSLQCCIVGNNLMTSCAGVSPEHAGEVQTMSGVKMEQKQSDSGFFPFTARQHVSSECRRHHRPPGLALSSGRLTHALPGARCRGCHDGTSLGLARAGTIGLLSSQVMLTSVQWPARAAQRKRPERELRGR